MHAPAIHDGRRDGFQFIPTDVNFFKFLQFCHFTKKDKIQGAGGQKIIIRQFKKKIIHNENKKGIYYESKDPLKIDLYNIHFMLTILELKKKDSLVVAILTNDHFSLLFLSIKVF